MTETLTRLAGEPVRDPREEDRRSETVGDDSLLFRRFLDGDDRAFMTLYDRHNHRLFLYCVKIVGDAAQAEDMTQEIWERVLRLRATRPEVQNPTGLLVTIARNLCLNHLKKRRHHPSIDEIDMSEHPTTMPRELTEMQELVMLSLPRLPFAQQEVLVLHSYSGYQFNEIAEMLGESMTAVKMRASRARANLARIVTAMLAMQNDGRDDSSTKEIP